MKKERIIELKNKTLETIKDEGIKEFGKKTYNFIKYKKILKNNKLKNDFKDLLFINGCTLLHPQRYRVDHQIEQLEAAGMTCSRVDYNNLTLDLVKYFRGFIIYRCPITPMVEEFAKIAKENNKVLFYDIDDLVFDTKYTDEVKFLDTFSKSERKLYDDGVRRMGASLNLCDYGIASTNRLQIEMNKYLKNTFINRNVASESMIVYSEKAMKTVAKDKSKIVFGYLSGSITHNDDFALIMKPLIEILEKNKNVFLKLVGHLDLPPEMDRVKDKIIFSEFVSWKKLPELICSIDVNLAPLENSIFNEAKSENKWTEAALCKVPTIASNVGAFSDMIQNEITGILCNNEDDWKKALEKMIINVDFRNSIGFNAYEKVKKDCCTINGGYKLANFIRDKFSKNYAFVLPSTNLSGGILVALKHATILKDNGYDVTIFNAEKCVEPVYYDNKKINVLSCMNTIFYAQVDVIVATMWLTLEFAEKYNLKGKIKYLVQGYETDFYENGRYERIKCQSTYNKSDRVDYLTISKWCEKWLLSDFGVKCKYIPNGINLQNFPYKKREFSKKIKILIEGNCGDLHKNVDEAFKITNLLDKNKYEIHYLSYGKEPKKWYSFDELHHKIPFEEVHKVYLSCDILLKTSILESFSYPPLEMMATGGYCVVLQNNGNAEYLKDKENCLFYEIGNYESAISKIESIVQNKKIRDQLDIGARITIESRNWENINERILKNYE